MTFVHDYKIQVDCQTRGPEKRCSRSENDQKCSGFASIADTADSGQRRKPHTENV